VPAPAAAGRTTYASGTPSPAARKILDKKNIAPAALTGTGKDGRITKEDAVNAVPSMGTLQEAVGKSAQNYRCCVVKAERLVAAKTKRLC
jgi:2-oxoglutarate dehydrogenase E2 component (dihydrolipoamide succinyltransferase)